MKPTFEVKQEGEEIVFKQIVEKRMSVAESMSEINVMKGEVDKLNQQLSSMKKAKEDDILTKDIEKLSVQVERLNKVYADWNVLIEPEMEKVDDNIRSQVRKAKLKTGYMRVKEPNAKIVLQNELLAPICEAEGIDMNCKMIRKMKTEFDKI